MTVSPYVPPPRETKRQAAGKRPRCPATARAVRALVLQPVLHAIRRRIRGLLSDGPAVLSPAGPPAARARTPLPAAASPPAETGPLSGPSGHRTSPASGQGLRYGLRPPQDHQEPAQPAMIRRWPSCVQHRHAARSRTTAGVLMRLAAFDNRNELFVPVASRAR